jgi:hypothetical protein
MAAGSRIGSVSDYAAITPADGTTTQAGGPWSALYVGGTGNVALMDMSGDTVILVGLAAGVWHAINYRRVRLTSTTATSIVGGHIS